MYNIYGLFFGSLKRKNEERKGIPIFLTLFHYFLLKLLLDFI